MKANNLVGEVFGRLTVICRNGSNKNGKSVWIAECECGELINVLGNSLITGNTYSCGCLQKEKAKVSIKSLHIKQWNNKNFIKSIKQNVKERFTLHGARSRDNLDPLYSVWRGMKQRCKFIKSYVRKNISVCEKWEVSFVVFREWAISNGYEKGKQLDRIDNFKNYDPSNCQYLTELEHRKKSIEETKIYHANRRVSDG